MTQPPNAYLDPHGFWSGHNPSPVDHRDLRYGLVAPDVPVSAIPATYDFEAQTPLPVADQGAIPACVGESLAGLKTAQEARELNTIVPFDGRIIYQAIKVPQGGAVLRDGLQWLVTIGAPAEGQLFKISSYAGVAPTDHTEVQHALYTSGVLVAGIHVPASFCGAGGKEFSVTPGTEDRIVGGHALLVVGWTAEGPILHNSWGLQWGDAGRATVSWQWWDTYAAEVWASVDAQDPTVAAKISAVQDPLTPLVPGL